MNDITIIEEWRERAERAEAEELNLLRRIKDVCAATRAAEVIYTQEIAELRSQLGNSQHRIMVLEAEVSARNAANIELGAELRYAQDQIAEFRRVTETGRADHGLVRAVASEFDDTANGNASRSGCSSKSTDPTDSPASHPLVSEVGCSEERQT